jgi:hypothetical protein
MWLDRKKITLIKKQFKKESILTKKTINNQQTINKIDQKSTNEPIKK